MGCFAYFRKTWRPGYGADVIDPNKAYDFERRVRFIKKLIVGLILLALLGGLICLIVQFTSSDKDCNKNGVLNGSDSLNKSLESLEPNKQALNQASLISGYFLNGGPVNRSNDDKNAAADYIVKTTPEYDPPAAYENEESEEAEIINGILESNGSNVVQGDISLILNNSDVALVSFQTGNGTIKHEHGLKPEISNGTPEVESTHGHHIEVEGINKMIDTPNKVVYSNLHPSVELVNHTEKDILPSSEVSTLDDTLDEPGKMGDIFLNSTFKLRDDSKGNDNSSEMWCSSTYNVVECIGFSKNFKTVTTFLTAKKHNTSAKGYVMVKMRNSTWHPYCHPNWTLEMGYKLCLGLGFQQLVELQTINIVQLKQRINSLSLGRHVSVAQRTQPEDILVLTHSKEDGQTSSSSPTSTTNFKLKTLGTGKMNCEVGYISCS